MHTLLKRTDPAENINRWYMVSIERNLFGNTAVVCRWGSLQTSYQQTSCQIVRDEEEAAEVARGIVEAKVKRGYIVVNSRQRQF